jgi:O-methyltransferase/methyltransferase family protein
MSPQESPHTTNLLLPAMALRQMLLGYRFSQSIYVAAKLGLADLLKDGPKGSDELATAVGAHPDALHRLLRVLASVGIFAQVDQRRFTLTPLGALLQTDVPGSWWGTAVLTGEWWWPAYGELLYSVTTGKPAHDHVYGMRNFEYFAQHPETGRLFHAGYAARRGPVSLAVAAAYDFSGVPLLIDVGGGAGDLMAAILQANPAMRGVVFDLPYTIDDARALVEAEGVAGRCDVVAGDFFASVPTGGHAYILRSVIHDWDDAHAVAILKNCHHAMQGQGKLLLVERVIPERAEQAPPVVLADLEMLVMTPSGRERTEAEFRGLFAAAGFKPTKIVPTPSEFIIIEGVPV